MTLLSSKESCRNLKCLLVGSKKTDQSNLTVPPFYASFLFRVTAVSPHKEVEMCQKKRRR